MIPIGILASSKRNVAASATLVRSRSVASTATLNFTEGTALDATHLLVAVVGGPSDVTGTPSGWTELADGGGSAATPIVYTRIFVKQGNGSTNGITISPSGSTYTLSIYAFAGFSTLTPLLTQAAGGTSTTRTLTPASTPSGQGVAIMAYTLFSARVVSFSNGYTKPATNHAGAGTFGTSGLVYKTYDSSVGTYDTTMTWDASSQRNRLQVAFLPLV